jgi:Glutathione-dependent formaldehyde-activating enzyme
VVADSQVALGTTSAGQVLIALLEIEAGLRRRNGHATSLEGGCLRGAVRDRISAEPRSADYCHCRMCRRAAGGPVVARLTVASAAFAWTKGEPAVYRSSAEAERLFCPAGAPVRASSPSSPLGLAGDAAWRQCVTMDLIGSACCRYLGLEGVSLAGGSNERALAR